MKKESQAVILDYLPYGKSGEATREPIAQAVGNSFFTLFELVINSTTADIRPLQIVELDFEKRKEVQRIRNRIKYQDLTPSSQQELEKMLPKLVKQREPTFINFINN